MDLPDPLEDLDLEPFNLHDLSVEWDAWEPGTAADPQAYVEYRTSFQFHFKVVSRKRERPLSCDGTVYNRIARTHIATPMDQSRPVSHVMYNMTEHVSQVDCA